jgi:hypothetical protein
MILMRVADKDSIRFQSSNVNFLTALAKRQTQIKQNTALFRGKPYASASDFIAASVNKYLQLTSFSSMRVAFDRLRQFSSLLSGQLMASNSICFSHIQKAGNLS